MGIEIMRWDFGLKVMEQHVIRCRVRSKADWSPVDETQKALSAWSRANNTTTCFPPNRVHPVDALVTRHRTAGERSIGLGADEL